MSTNFKDVAEQALLDGVIRAEEVAALRLAGWASGSIEPELAEEIFAINARVSVPCSEWSDFFVEAIADYVVNGLSPRGYVTEANARWFIDHVDADGCLCSLTELEALVRILETSHETPEMLRLWAIGTIERMVLTGEGPMRGGGMLEKGKVNEAEALILRRVLFASGSDRPAAVSRREAELLFRLKDETLGADNALEWKALFVQGVGSYLQGFVQHTPLGRERAAELEAFMKDTGSSVGGFMGRVLAMLASPAQVVEAFGRKGTSPELDALVAAAREITGEEADWLDGRIARNGEVDEYDKALLRFLAQD